MPRKVKSRNRWKEWEETTLYIWLSATDEGDDETCGDQNDDGETNTILGFTGIGLSDLTIQSL
jgi:hypothetical protein